MDIGGRNDVSISQIVQFPILPNDKVFQLEFYYFVNTTYSGAETLKVLSIYLFFYLFFIFFYLYLYLYLLLHFFSLFFSFSISFYVFFLLSLDFSISSYLRSPLQIAVDSTTLGTLTGFDSANGFAKRSYDVSQFSGGNHTLSFSYTSSASWDITFIIDTVSIVPVLKTLLGKHRNFLFSSLTNGFW